MTDWETVVNEALAQAKLDDDAQVLLVEERRLAVEVTLAVRDRLDWGLRHRVIEMGFQLERALGVIMLFFFRRIGETP